MTRAMKLSITDFRIGFFVAILPKKRSKEKLTRHPIIIPAGKEPTQTVCALHRATLYSAAMGSREVAMEVAQKANPPTTVSTTILLQISFDWAVFFRPLYLIIVILFLFLNSHNQKPQSKSNFRNEANRISWISKYSVVGEKETL
jgi:hypothetical protein